MTDIRKDLQNVVADVRAHVEFQRALGVKTLEMPSLEACCVAISPAVTKKPSAAPVQPAMQEHRAPATVDIGKTQRISSKEPVSLEAVREEIGDCTRCKLNKGRHSIVFGEGNPKAAIVFVGEGPGFEEDQQGRPFVGAAGQLLTDIIVKGMGLKREDVYICNIVKCRPPGNRNPEPDEVDACIGFVKKQIAAIQPKVIVTLGNVPTQNLLNTKQGITKMRGTWQEYDGIPVMPTFHPSYLLRSPGEKKRVWEDIKLVMKLLGLAVQPKESGARGQESGEKP